ncbi:MAG: dihydroxyacetone kinase subunit DhaL [Chloroflexota bacterium]
MTISKQQLIQWLQSCAEVLDANKTQLTELDSAIGDADHGTNIARGFGIVAEKAAEVADKDIGTIFKTTSMTLMSKVGGASGMLYGNFFMKASASANKAANKDDELTASEFVNALEAGLAGIVQRGRAEVGDKTMLDAWTPALEALKSGVAVGQSLDEAMASAVDAAKTGMQATIPMQAKKGRASYLGERSIGHQDPGATSTYLMLKALSDTISS